MWIFEIQQRSVLDDSERINVPMRLIVMAFDVRHVYGFRDTSRLAAGDPALWKQVFALNRDNVVQALEQFGRHLEALTTAIREDDRTALEEILNQAKKTRDALGS